MISEEEIKDLKDFVNDIIAIQNNYTNNDNVYYPEDLEEDFYYTMKKWREKIVYYKWGEKR